MKSSLILCLIVGAFFSSFAQQAAPDPKEQLKEYFFVLLKRGPNRNQPQAVADSIQKAHLAHIDKMAKSGKLNIAGPFGDKGEWIGILIFNTKTADEAREMVEQDPAVKSGRIIYEIHPLWSRKGAKLE